MNKKASGLSDEEIHDALAESRGRNTVLHIDAGPRASDIMQKIYASKNNPTVSYEYPGWFWHVILGSASCIELTASPKHAESHSNVSSYAIKAASVFVGLLDDDLTELDANEENEDNLYNTRKYNENNYRQGLIEATGINPIDAHAHHVFVQNYEDIFAQQYNINIHHPEHMVWWEAADHLKNAYDYNEAWRRFLLDDRSRQDIFEFGRDLMNEYGIKVRY